MGSALPTITERFLDRDRTALARLITWAENRDQRFERVLEKVWDRVGRAWRIGITGPPGAGKSTFVNQLAKLEREAQREVGILAVDPSSPFTGGALLGDRIRMEERTLDPGVFIRSMASRESHGGLARAAIDATDIMDAFGFDTLLIETVGVGQAEYDVVRAADTVCVVLCPGAGDGVQAMKAGLLEVADVLVVNKSDQSGADRLVQDLEEAVHVRMNRRREWDVPVVACSAGRGEGVELVRDAIGAHRAWREREGLASARRGQRLEQIREVVGGGLAEFLWERSDWGARVEREYDGREAPIKVARRMLDVLSTQLSGGAPGSIASTAAGAGGEASPERTR